MKVISVFNQKGGVGKTTTVVNLSVALTYLNKKVLVIDMDPQANTTSGFGLDKFSIENSIYDLFCDLTEKKTMAVSVDAEEAGQAESSNENNIENTGEEIKEDKQEPLKENNEETEPQKGNSDDEEANKDSIKEEEIEKIEENTAIYEIEDIDKYISTTEVGVDIITSQPALSGIEVELVDLDPYERTQELKEIMEEIRKKSYDYVLIDCPPSLGLLSINALVASDSILAPVQTEYYALEGVSELMNTFSLVKNQLNKDLEIEGVLLTMFDKRTFLSYEVVEEIKNYFKSKVFKVMIPRTPRLAESPSHGLSTIQYDPDSQGALAYMMLADEIIKKESEIIND
ncbi:ParA family protein [Anaerococcus sp. Marseille-P3625]|uniref:ParA family protein n=1 Tax=Anaerococcus sp. Marseille-P3625 TaxID=1977277 RepID=UPI000C082AB9|nr:AAA family ATPase [Anaerococcus sp. Marseille-P3625]